LNQSTVKDFQPPKPVNYVKLHDFSRLLPAKACLAKEYIIFGEAPAVCLHNADVAEKYGLMDLRNAWKLARMILCSEVPLDILMQDQRKEPIMTVAKKAGDMMKRRDSGVFVDGSDVEDRMSKQDMYGRIKWGSHPLGGRWMVDRL